MIYFGNPCSPAIRHAMRAGALGMIATPAQGNALVEGIRWAADNGCYGKGYPGDHAYLAWLADRSGSADRCWFATAPDVVGDASATLARSAPFLPVIRGLGYPAALVGQNGLEHLDVPWDDFDVLFLGGDDEWKLGNAARDLASEALSRGKRVHMGRVNSRKRLLYAHGVGCKSADGTYLRFGPDKNLSRLLGWLADLEQGHD